MSTPTLDGKERWQSALLAEFSSAREVAKTQIPEGSTCVLLGECTHGTEEFYELRAEITKYLIEVRGFKIVLCEADWTFMWHVNQYIHRKRAKPFPDNIRFPKWMWQNRPFFELVEWMRKRASSDGPYLFGMDCYCKDESKEEVMKFLDLHARNTLGKEFRGTCFPTEKPDRWPGILAKLQWEIQNDLAGVPAEDDANDSGSTASKRRRRSGAGALQQGACGNVILSSKSFRGCTNLDQFNAEQNLECMIAADEYYSKQRLEPPGSRASWNARDQHMMTTVIRLRENSLHLFNQEKEDLKIVIWAHNSHVGDATATPMGGANFERNEKWNLGQMCRNMLDSVFIVGFYSNCGQVRAAHKWGGEGVTMKLRDAMENSFEARMRRWFGPGGKGYINFSRLRKQQASSSTSTPALKEPTQVAQIYNPSQAGSFAPLNVEYRAVHTSVQLTRTRELPKEGDAAPAPSGETRNEFPVDINASFIAVERAQVHTKYRQVITRLQIKSYQGRSELDGYWVTEHVSGSCGSTSIHCLPAAWLDTCNSNAVKSQETMQSVELLTRIVNFPMQQRWVGVQYHPETELKSHYGEMVVSRCYDLVMYVDKTNAIGMDMTNEAHSLSTAEQDLLATPAQEDQGIKTGGSVTSTAAAPKQTNRRLMMELRRITKEPVDFIQARPLDNNILEWHFVLEGTQEPYTKGKYHGILEFPDEFPAHIVAAAPAQLPASSETNSLPLTAAAPATAPSMPGSSMVSPSNVAVSSPAAGLPGTRPKMPPPRPPGTRREVPPPQQAACAAAAAAAAPVKPGWKAPPPCLEDAPAALTPPDPTVTDPPTALPQPTASATRPDGARVAEQPPSENTALEGAHSKEPLSVVDAEVFCPLTFGQPVEARIREAWRRVTLLEFNEEDRTWLVEEFWGGLRHSVPQSQLRPCQEACFGHGVEPGMAVCCRNKKARTVRRERMDDGRKAWRVCFERHADEEVVAVESVEPWDPLRMEADVEASEEASSEASEQVVDV